jgi:hypothetical protein
MASYVAVLKQLMGLQAAGRQARARADDLWLVSYPKSGNTWLRFLLANLFSESPIDFRSIERAVPDIYVNSMWTLLRMPTPRILKSHEPVNGSYRRVIYILRDPRDVAISYWKHQQKMHKLPLDSPLASFVEAYMDGSLPYGSWRSHVEGWIDGRQADDEFVVLRYEDLLVDPAQELKRIVGQFSGLPPLKTDYSEAVARSSFEQMQALEVEQHDQWAPIRTSRESIRFMRHGKSGQWKTELPAPLAQTMWRAWGDLMQRFGYEAE